MKRKIELLLAFLLLSISCAFAQKLTVKGTVLDETGQSIIGATVREKGVATNGASTDMDGHFTLTVNQGATIIVSYVGYQTQEVKAAAQLTIKMVPDSELLDEVMVVAFGTAKKESFTGSAVVVDSKTLEKTQANDAVKALEGVVPGLQIANTSGAPGESSTMRVRGIGSINASKSPLIIMDGAPYDGNLNSINPRDIASINVLKDASSSALYGARGANGVIIITTKRGKEGLTQVSFDARIGQNQRGVPEYDVITDPGMFYELYWEMMRNENYFAEKNPLTLEAAGQKASEDMYGRLGYNIYDVPNNTIVTPDGKLNPNAKIKYKDAGTFNDWAKELLHPQMRSEYNLSMTRGTEKAKTFFSLGYLKDNGYALKTDFSRISSRLSYDVDLYKWLKLSASSQLSYTSGNYGNTGGGAFSNVFNYTRHIAPIYPVYLHDKDGNVIMEDGKAVYDVGDAREGINGSRSYGGGKNVIGEILLDRDDYKSWYLTDNLRADVDLSHGFKFNTTFAYSLMLDLMSYYKNPVMGDGISYNGMLAKTTDIYQTINWNQVLTYDFKLGDFGGQAMLGHESYGTNFNRLRGEKQNTLDPLSTQLNTYAATTSLSSNRHEYRVEGYFGQLTANYLEKYYISASLRRDGSSIFSPSNRWGTFWSLGASWRLDQEEFMKADWLNSLKLRASVGQQGNDGLLDPDGYRVWTPYETQYLISNDGTNNSFAPALLGNPEITWEKNLNYSLGLEFAVLDHRLTGEIEYFSRKTTDMLFNEPVSKTTGFTYKPMNIGSMINRGFEIKLDGTIVRTDDVTWSVGVNGSGYNNTILQLPERFKEEGLSVGNRILREGGSIYDYYLVHYVGVDPETGNTQYEKHNDEYDANDPESKEFLTVLSDDYRSEIRDRQFVGSALPKMEGGFNTALNAYGFDFSAQFSYRIGGKMFDNGYASLMHSGSKLATNWHKDILGRWTPTNKNTNIPRLQSNKQKLISTSDMFMIDGSYLALRNITLGYSIPRDWALSVGFQSARLYVTCDNAFVWSHRKGLDPRTSLSGSSAGNLASAIRTISGGVTITL